jgi:formate dehydrogenase subunit gamma
LLKQVPRIEGRIDIPDTKAAVLIQPAGRTWDYFHEVLLHRGGAIVILGMIVILALAYLVIGRLRISGGRSGQKIVRFRAFERFSHWLTAASFVVLGLTGLNITFGKILLLPVIGPDAFSRVAEAAKYVHNFTSFAFVAGLILIVAIFFKDNLFDKVDVAWVKQGGGFIKNKHAPAGRFNLGEKLVYWLSLAAGVAVSLSGFLLLFPFYGTNIADMQLAQVVHAVVAVLFIALILGHIYIGTLGMEGAFEAMGSGEVDLNWAKEHHDLWLAQQLANQDRGAPAATPAE